MMIMLFMLMGMLMIFSLLGLEMLGYIFSFLIILMIMEMGGMILKFSLNLGMGMDIISYSMVLLTLLVGKMMFLGESKLKSGSDIFIFKILVLFLIIFLISAFLCLNMMMFYLFFELVLVPMVLLILIYGYQPERLESGIYMLMYTMFGSLPLLIGIMLMYKNGYSLEIYYMMSMKHFFMSENWSWLILLAFLVKLPLYSVHIWLPKAHVEAPVSGSSILAGVLLKLGCYGLFRFFIFTNIPKMFESLILIVGLWGGIMSSMMCFRQLDMKKLVAYSSIVHMSFFFGGVISMSGVGMLGGLVMMLGHGVCSSGLFFFVNLLYERTMSRSLLISKGMLVMCPSVMMWGFLLVACNSAAPPFLNFFGEVMLGMGLLYFDLNFSFIMLIIYFVGVGYGIYFYSVLCHGASVIMKFMVIKVSEYYILFFHFLPGLGLIFLVKYLN